MVDSLMGVLAGLVTDAIDVAVKPTLRDNAAMLRLPMALSAVVHSEIVSRK